MDPNAGTNWSGASAPQLTHMVRSSAFAHAISQLYSSRCHKSCACGQRVGGGWASSEGRPGVSGIIIRIKLSGRNALLGLSSNEARQHAEVCNGCVCRTPPATGALHCHA